MLETRINMAAELGPQRFDWWPNYWKGKTCAVVACGPSVKAADVDKLKGLPTIAVKEAVLLCPWADVVYGCDWPWWLHRRGLPEFKGLKVAWDHRAVQKFKDVRKITIAEERKNKYVHQLMVDEPGVIGGGGNSGFQALNLAVQFGARVILLLGFDMQGRSGTHFYGRNLWAGANNPDDSNFVKWKASFAEAAIVLSGLGVEVINTSPISELKCFPHMSVDDALNLHRV